MKQYAAHPSLALISVHLVVVLCASHLERDCVPVHGFVPENASSSFTSDERKDMGFGGPAAGELARAEGVGQVRHLPIWG